MILKQPFDFKLLSLVNNQQTVQAINRYIAIDYAYIRDKEMTRLKPFKDGHVTLNPVILYGLSDTEKDVPAFRHPIVDLQHNWIALDVRHLVKLNAAKDAVEVKNQADYSLAIQRFTLTGLWYTGKQSSVYNLKLGHFAFASWLSENITRKFGLDLQNQLQLQVLALLYYAHLFTDDFTQDDFDKLAIRSKENVLVPKLLDEVKEAAGELETIDDFCRACYKVTGNIRLKDFDYVVLSNLLSTNWPAADGKELVTLSLEHPPTWLTLVSASLTNRSFKKSFVASIVDKLDKRGKGEDFLDALGVIVKEQMEGRDA